MDVIQNCYTRMSNGILREAVSKGDYMEVKAFLDSGECFESTHGSALCLATQNKQYAITELLLDHGFDVNTKDYRGNHPIHYSVELNDLESAKLLLQRGADISNHSSLLFTAARKEFPEMVKILAEFGADINESDQYGQTALHYAVLQDGALFTFLKESKMKNHSLMEGVVRALLSAGANVNAKTENGFTALHYAVSSKYPNIVATLLEHGADVLSYIDRHILKPKKAEFNGKLDNCRTYSRSSFVLSNTSSLTTVIHVVSKSNDPIILKMLLDAGAKVDAVQRDGRTPLIVAVEHGNHKIVEVLLEYGADVELSNKNGMTPLHLACLKGSAKVVDLLLAAGADINAACKNGRVPYQYLSQYMTNLELDGFLTHYISWHGRHYEELHRSYSRVKTSLQTQIVMMHVNQIELVGCNKDVASRLVRDSSGPVIKGVRGFSKSLRIVDDTTLDRVFSDVDNPTYARNSKFEQQLDVVKYDLNEIFPTLGNVSKYLVRKAKKRNTLIDVASEKFMMVVGSTCGTLPPLPAEVVIVILQFLSDEDLHYFMRSAETDASHYISELKKRVDNVSN